MKRTKQIIQVAGDAAIDIFHYPRAAACGKNLPAWKSLPGLSEMRQRGGSLLLADLIQAALSECNVLSDNIESAPLISRMRVADYGGIWRAASLDGFDETNCTKAPALSRPAKEQSPDVLVLFDSDNGFSADSARWPASLRDSSFAGKLFIRLCNPLTTSPLMTKIQTLRKNKGGFVVAMVDADDLREAGAAISRGLSWERTMTEFCTELLKNETPHPLLKQSDFLIVRFGYEGAIVVDCRKTLANLDEAPSRLYVEGSLLFDNGSGEGDLDRSFQGNMTGITSVFLAGLLYTNNADSSSLLATLKQGVRLGLSATRAYLKSFGFGKSNLPPSYPLEQLGAFLREDKQVSDYSEAELIELSNTDPCTPDSSFAIMEKLIPDTLLQLAALVVKKGNLTFMNVPKGVFGKLLTVERSEIENYRKIQNLMLEYLAQPVSPNPLSFAVFGPPGSGKSFGVKQLAVAIEKSSTVKLQKMVFNLSEFASPEELVAAFHKVHDVVLGGKVPLVFFDEFDSGKEGHPLFWLKYFLAPMQDGEFRDGPDVHPIGKAIFVFAGGTCETYKKFSEGTGADFKAVKGPDFVSRLRGHLNIMGPNPVSATDYSFIVRRALLFRNFLEERAKDLGTRRYELIGSDKCVLIDEGLLTAFLQVPKYRHGVRSMQSLIGMSAITQGRGYRKSEIPAFDQLDMHVDAQAFLYLLHRDDRFTPHVNKIARLIHEGYLADRKAEGTLIADKPSHQPWSKLEEKFIESNRGQARDIPAKLSLYDLRIQCDIHQEKATFSKDEVDYLARVEHQRWMVQEKQTPTMPVHPCMVHWEKLSDEEKAKDIKTIERIPEYLAACGLVMVRGAK